MLFTSLQFLIFFLAVWGLVGGVPRRYRGPALLTASLAFYAMWIPSFAILLLATMAVNFGLMHAIARGRHPRIWLTLALTYTLGLLAYFKYATFLLESLLPILPANVGSSALASSVVLPLGISFYSFQMLGLTIDVYRRDIEPVASFGRYALFVSFFPQLIAGPIVRGDELLPQLESGGVITAERTRRGLRLICLGLAKKAILADCLLAPFVDVVFGAAGAATAPYLLVAAYSFAFQIYFDFSGYTDLARGLGLLLGFELPMNFREPYWATSPADFWRRWHITLSTWLRDYLYIPLGGNRHGRAATTRNLMITMVLGGLWHGAAWTFVVWGTYHGIILVVHRALKPVLARVSPRGAPGRVAWRVLRVTIVFHLVVLGWILFRAPTLADAWTFVSRMLTTSYQVAWPVFECAVVGLCGALHGLETAARKGSWGTRQVIARAWAYALEGAALGALSAVALVLSTGRPFIYFEF